MGKRTDYKRNIHDFYPTKDPKAVLPLVPHLKGVNFYDEPCAGSGDLVRLLGNHGLVCQNASDLVVTPNAHVIVHKLNVFDILETDAGLFITNPPWTWEILTELIPHLSGIAPTWLLLNADLMHNKRMAPHMRRCVKVVSVGRVSWMNNGKAGMENSAWYLFDGGYDGPTEFIERLT